MTGAVVGIKAEVSEYRDVLEKIKKTGGVTKAFGRYDIIAVIEAENTDEIANIVTQRICTIAGIKSTETWVEAKI